MKKKQPGTPALAVHRLTEGSQLVLCDSDTVLLVVRGSCKVKNVREPEQHVNAGSLLHAAGAGSLDMRVARALALLQAQPEQRWTVQRLARKVGLSRSAFARRFAELSGRSPRRYLTELRLALAQHLLETTNDSLAELARRVGYGSEFSLSRAFKRKLGVAPGLFRRLKRSAFVSSPPARAAA